jgi:hypothetical protein
VPVKRMGRGVAGELFVVKVFKQPNQYSVVQQIPIGFVWKTI